MAVFCNLLRARYSPAAAESNIMEASISAQDLLGLRESAFLSEGVFQV